MFYTIKNHCFDLKSVRNVSVDLNESKLHIHFKCGSDYSITIRFNKPEEALEWFELLCFNLKEFAKGE